MCGLWVVWVVGCVYCVWSTYPPLTCLRRFSILALRDADARERIEEPFLLQNPFSRRIEWVCVCVCVWPRNDQGQINTLA